MAAVAKSNLSRQESVVSLWHVRHIRVTDIGTERKMTVHMPQKERDCTRDHASCLVSINIRNVGPFFAHCQVVVRVGTSSWNLKLSHAGLSDGNGHGNLAIDSNKQVEWYFG